MFQAIQIETQTEQQGLANLHAQRTTRSTSRELPFHRREQAFDQGPASVKPLREGPPHFGTYSMHAPCFLPALGGNHTLRSESLADVGVITLAIELGVGQHQPDARLLGSGFDDGGQISAIIPRAASR